MPALQTSSSIGPRSFSTVSTQRSTSSALETSPTRSRPPASVAIGSVVPRVRPGVATCIPASASSRTIEAPIPRPPPVTSATPSRRSDGTLYLLERLRVLECGEVPRVLSERAGAHRPADDLRAPCLRQGRHEDDAVRCERLAELLRHGGSDVVGRCLPPWRADAVQPRDLALDLVGNSDSGGLGDSRMPYRSGLELGWADPLPRDVERVVGAPVQEPVAVLVDGGPVAVRPHPGKTAPVRLEVALGIAPDSPRHSRPRALADELPHLAAHGPTLMIEDVDVLTQRRESDRDGLRRLEHCHREEAGAHFGSSRAVDDGDASLAAHVRVEPVVRTAVPGLAGRDHRSQRREVTLRLAVRDERPDERR